MSDGERGEAVNIASDTARALIDEQFPKWSGEPLAIVSSAGADNAIFRLGTQCVARFPRFPDVAQQVEKEWRWLPHLAPLPLDIPRPLAVGEAGAGYPFPWAVNEWIEGEPVAPQQLNDTTEAGETLAELVLRLRGKDTSDGPPSGAHNHYRGVPLDRRDKLTRDAIEAVGDLYPCERLIYLWDASLAASPHGGPPVWLHGDIHAGNLLMRGGRLTGLIDFGLMGVGDPACDLMVAWSLLPESAREMFRFRTDADEAEWTRGKGWALSVAVIALAYYRERNKVLAAQSRRTIEAVLKGGRGS